MEGEALVRDYLGQLETEARRLPPDRRTELLGDVGEHIDRALAEAGSRDEATVRTVLDRLGSPASIVDAEAQPAMGSFAPAAGPMVVARSQGQGLGLVEIVALLLLTVGCVALPFVGPLAGLVFVWASPQWETRHKAVATVIVIGLMALAMLILAAFVFSSPGS
jgi:HAAS